MGYAFLIITFLFSGINNYLIPFSRLGEIPYPFGYLNFAKVSHLAIGVMSIWYLGWIFGIVFFLAYILNVFYFGFMWIVEYLLILKHIIKNEKPKLSINIYFIFFSILVCCIVVLTIVSFFVSKYCSLRHTIEYNDYKLLIMLGIIFVSGFLLRLFVPKKQVYLCWLDGWHIDNVIDTFLSEIKKYK